jgi:hypothetical protein
VAFDRFVDDVSVLAIEECLISKLPDLLKPSRVHELGTEEIQRLVGESEETASSRTKLNEKRTLLQKGLQDLKRFQTHRVMHSPAPPKAPKPSSGSANGHATRLRNHAPETKAETSSDADGPASDVENRASEAEAEVHGSDREEHGLRPLSLVQQLADADDTYSAGMKKKMRKKAEKKKAQDILARYEEPEPAKADENYW